MVVASRPNVITDAVELKAAVAEYLERPAFCYDLETIGRHRINPRSNIVTVVAMATDGRHDVIPISFPHGELNNTTYPLTAGGEARKLEFEAAGKVFKPRKSEYSVDASKAIKTWNPAPPHLDHREAFDILEPLMMSDRLKVGHNLKFDIGSMYKYYDAFPPPPYADTMVAAFLCNSSFAKAATFERRGYTLRATAFRETGFWMEKGVGANVALHGWNDVMHYAATDTKWTWLTWRMLRRKIAKRGLQEVMDLEMRVLEVLLEMERVGAPIDHEALVALDHRMVNKRDGLLLAAETQVYAAAGHKFPIGSNKVKGQLLFAPKEQGGQGLTARVFTKGGDFSVSSDALEPFRKRNKLVEALLEYADLAKLHSTYIHPYLYGPTPKENCPPDDLPLPLVVDGRIRADFNQIGAETGRFSCRAPNLQNVPGSDTEMGKAIRGLFIAPPGCKLIVADYSQVELRVLAHLAQEPTMIAAFNAGEDIHQTVADALGIPRKGGKALGFAVVFGAGSEKVADMAGCGVREAKKFMALYDERFAGIVRWKYQRLIACRREKPTPCVRTILGRTRYLPNVVNNAEPKWQAAAERQVANTIVQGSAADIIKTAMVRAYTALPADCPMILTVHDELVTIAPTGFADQAVDIIAEAMQGAFQLRVPLPADIKIVDRWSEAK